MIYKNACIHGARKKRNKNFCGFFEIRRVYVFIFFLDLCAFNSVIYVYITSKYSEIRIRL